ncbi:odorant receptor 131-2-like [Puntigrus tetrazona]|uniref:odorant receptor 131-2-like n=1 Tax=Puntigrus tetrazona TaxID=1606681 RepID=UPI001C8AE6C1|nr:odorant receptor 131-2-like [Puntigrus tetrazona]
MSNLDVSNITLTVVMDQTAPVKVFLSMTPCVIFLYVNGVMLFTLSKKTVFQEKARYILFGHMLWVDTLNLCMSVVLYICAVSKISIMKNVCFVLLFFTTALLHVSVLNLALMSLERYVAICFPLRHAEIITSERTKMAIGIVWMMSLIQPLSDMITFYAVDSTSAVMNLFCSRTTLFRLQIYKKLEISISCVFFVSVCFVIIFTYASIAAVAKTASGDKMSAKKANKTVLLHLLQLVLGLVSLLLEPIFEAIYVRLGLTASVNLMYFFFAVFIIFPRCLSPLVYGLRDQAFGVSFKYYFTLGLKRQNRCNTEIHVVARGCKI